ncbi:MAG: phage tail tape measure protein [Culicoidibacterales bacterium]
MKLIFELVVQDVNVTAELLKQKQLVKELSKEMQGIDAGADGFEELANKLAAARVQVLDLTKQQKELNREFKATQVPTDSLEGLRLEYAKLTEQTARLTAEQRKSYEGKALIKNANSIKNEINSIQESLGNFTGSVGNYRKAMLSIADIATAGIALGGIERAIDLVSNALVTGVKEFTKYERVLDNLSALTGLVGADLDRFKNKALELTTIQIGDFEIKNTAAEIVEAFKIVGGAQPELLKSADALAFVSKEAIVLSKASGLDLKDSVDAIVVSLGQFSLNGSEAARVSNELAAGARAGASEIPDTAKALKEFGTTAAVVNVSTGESISLIQTLAEQQLKGAEAGTQLRNVLVRLSAAEVLPKNALVQLEQAGVNIDILRNNSLPLETRLQELSKIAGNTAALVKTFGVENLTAAQILTQNVGRYKDFVKQVEGTNEAYKQAEINSGNLSTAYENLQKDGINAAVEAFETLSPVLAFVLNLFSGGLKTVIAFFSALRQLPQFIKENKVEFIGLGTGLVLLNGQLILASANNIRLAAATRLQAIATAAATLAQNGLNAAMRANPIGLVITAVSSLAILFQTAYQKSQLFRASISGLGAVAFEIFKLVSESFQSFSKGFGQILDGDFSGALESFGDSIKKGNPIGIAFTQGQRLKEAFNTGYNNKVDEDKRAEEQRKSAEQQIQDQQVKSKKILEIDDELNEKIDRNAKQNAQKREQEIKDQLKRIDDIQKSIRDLDAGTITNDFDRQNIEIENRRAEALDKVAESRESLTQKIAQQKGVLSDADKKELGLISEQTASIIASYDLQKETVEKNRQAAIDQQLNDLARLSLEVTNIAQENAAALARAESEIINTGFAKDQAELEAVLNERKRALTAQLEEGTISQKRFKSEYIQAQEAFNIGSLQLERDRADAIEEINENLENARIDAAKAALAVRLQAIESETQAEITAARNRATTQGGDAGAAVSQLELRAMEQRASAQQQYSDQVREANDERVKSEIDAAEKINDANERLHEDNLERLDEEKEKRRELQQAALDAAGTIAGAIFEIERNRIEQQEEAQISALDTEFAKRREAAAGNAELLAKIDADYAKKKEAIEKEAARKRKQNAIVEAVIQGALAVVKSLPNLVLAALTAVATAAQIAVISSQNFAGGGIPTFRKSGMFGGRRHSMGGTKGVFDDGTQIEVERDEIFVILNRRASADINRLSAFNAMHGGRRFDTGGILDFTPQFGQTINGQSGGAVFVVAEFTDEQIDVLSGRIADRTGAATQTAVIAGLDDRNRTAERQISLEANREV